jgi:hypothetical protein
MIIGVDPHTASVTIEVIDERAVVAARGRFATHNRSYDSLLSYARRSWGHRVWAVEGAAGVGRPLAQRLLADGEPVVNVPAKLAARVRVLDTGPSMSRAARPTPPTPMPLPRSRCAPRPCGGCQPTTRTWSRCGCWLTAAMRCPGGGCRR